MSYWRFCLTGMPGELKWDHIKVGVDVLPCHTRSITYTFTWSRLPSRDNSLDILICVDDDVVRPQKVSFKKFVSDHIKSGRRLFIYPWRSDIDLSHNLIYLGPISYILNEEMQRSIQLVKQAQLEQSAEKLSIDKEDTAAGDEDAVVDIDANCVDYY